MKIKLLPGKNDDHTVYIATLVLSAVSLVMVASASVGIASQQSDAVSYNMIRQVVYFLIGYALMMFFYYNFSARLVRGLLPFVVVALTALLILTLIYAPVNGAKAWLHFFGFSLQPSEFVKVYIILYLAIKLTRKAERNLDFWTTFKWPTIVLGLWFVIIAYLQSDLGTAIVIAMITAICLLVVPGKALRLVKLAIKLGFIAACLFVGFLATATGVAFIEYLPIANYQKLRFIGFVNPFYEIDRGTYQLFQSLRTFARGKFFGVGFGNSQQKFGYLPEARTDFILPIIIEELGLFGLALVVLPYCAILYNIFHYAVKTEVRSEKVILVGTIAYLFVHFLLNVGGVSALIPMTGVPLLLISSGGSSTMSVMLLLGICQNIINKIRWEENASN